MSLARRVDLLVSYGYQLLDSPSDAERKARASAVAESLSSATAELQTLRGGMLDKETASAIESRLADLNKALTRTDTVVGQSLAARSKLAELPKKAAVLNSKLTNALRPLVIERGNNTAGLIGEMASPSSTSEARAQAATSLKALGYVPVALANIGQSRPSSDGVRANHCGAGRCGPQTHSADDRARDRRHGDCARRSGR